jgi:hypothetical protein
MRVANKSQKNPSFSETIINKRFLISLLSFIFLTVLLYSGLGRPDLLQPQLQQKKIRTSVYTKPSG